MNCFSLLFWGREGLKCTIILSGLIIGCIFLPSKSYAQLCEGSLGDPVVNITFGSGGNPGQLLL